MIRSPECSRIYTLLSGPILTSTAVIRPGTSTSLVPPVHRSTLALPTATIGTMAPEASANAMYANKIAAIDDPEERAAYIAARVAEQEAELNLLRMGSEIVVDAVVEPPDLRAELIARFAAADGWERTTGRRHHTVSPV